MARALYGEATQTFGEVGLTWHIISFSPIIVLAFFYCMYERLASVQRGQHRVLNGEAPVHAYWRKRFGSPLDFEGADTWIGRVMSDSIND